MRISRLISYLGLQNQLKKICIIALFVAGILVAAFILTSAIVQDPVQRDGLLAAWLIIPGVLNVFYCVLFYRYGNMILKLLHDAMDPELQSAIERVIANVLSRSHI